MLSKNPAVADGEETDEGTDISEEIEVEKGREVADFLEDEAERANLNALI